MGNYIKTKNGVTIDLNIPAVIESFSTETTSSHVSRGKLKVFSIGKTQDIRVFTKSFAESLMKSLPGTPVVAYFDNEKQDFLGHNDTQYVYGYVPEDAVPEFIEEGNTTWAVVDINLFTERDDNIGEVAKQIIGKSQSLELNPDTVDWELVYINGKLEKIVFKEGSFYGLSVLGDDQTPAFEGAGFFKPEIIESLKSFTLENGGKKMNKEEFLSLGSYEKQVKLYQIIKEQTNKEDFFVVDFTEEEVIIRNYSEDDPKWEIASYTWLGETEYSVGEFEECIPTFTRVNKESGSLTDSFAKKKEEETNCGDIDDTIAVQVEESSIDLPSEETETTENDASVETNQDSEAEGEDTSTDAASDASDGLDSSDGEGQASSFIEDKEEPDESDDKKDDEKEDKEDEDFRKDKERKCESIPTVATSLSNEERNELMELRKEKKISLIKTFTEYLSKESIDKFLNDIEKYDLITLEAELKIAAFEENKGRILENTDSHNSFGVILPSISEKKEFSNELDTLVAQNL